MDNTDMNIVTSREAIRFKNSDACIAIEYPMKNEKDINGAVIELTGRYPETGSAVNDISKELVYILSGEGTLSYENRKTALHTGDLVLIHPGQAYYFEGTMNLFIASTPAWNPDQHRTV